MLDKIKKWFKYSESIFLARAIAFGGFVTSAVGFMDWSPIWTLLQTGTYFSSKQLLWMGMGIVGAGISFEIARRRNDPVLNKKTK